ncbi:hypothetical protein ACS0TY_026700 [Phlomoides rotata]
MMIYCLKNMLLNIWKRKERQLTDSDEDGDIVYVERDFDEYKNSDGEQDERNYPVFNPEVIYEPEFELGMIFSNRDEFKKAVQSHAIKTKRSLIFSKTAPTRVYAKCSNEDCSWKVHLNKVKDENSFQIRQYNPKHSCGTTYHVRNLKANWLSERFLKKFVSDPKKTIRVFRQDAIDELGCEISKGQAYRAKRLALKKLEGSPDIQFSKLWDYAEELRRSNPGSTVLLGTKWMKFI